MPTIIIAIIIILNFIWISSCMLRVMWFNCIVRRNECSPTTHIEYASWPTESMRTEAAFQKQMLIWFCHFINSTIYVVSISTLKKSLAEVMSNELCLSRSSADKCNFHSTEAENACMRLLFFQSIPKCFEFSWNLGQTQTQRFEVIPELIRRPSGNWLYAHVYCKLIFFFFTLHTICVERNSPRKWVPKQKTISISDAKV